MLKNQVDAARDYECMTQSSKQPYGPVCCVVRMLSGQSPPGYSHGRQRQAPRPPEQLEKVRHSNWPVGEEKPRPDLNRRDPERDSEGDSAQGFLSSDWQRTVGRCFPHRSHVAIFYEAAATFSPRGYYGVRVYLWFLMVLYVDSADKVFCTTNLGTPKFPFSYLTHVTLLAPAQAQLRLSLVST